MSTPVVRQHLPSADRVKEHAQHTAQEARPWVVRLGRFGHAAHGVVYAAIGILAARAAIGTGGTMTDSQGALRWIVQAPFGRGLLGLIAVGLAGYALWRFVQAIRDTEGKGTEAGGIVARGSYLIIGVIHAGLALFALRLALGSDGGGTGDDAARDWTARLLTQPFGPWLVGLVGVVVIGVSLQQFYSAYRAKFREELKLAEMNVAEQRWATRAGRLGDAARGIVFLIIGGFLIVAAMQAEPQQARGLGGALTTLAQQPFGPWLLGVVALGLIAYGVFAAVQARFRRMVVR